jgi:hypothetical protein
MPVVSVREEKIESDSDVSLISSVYTPKDLEQWVEKRSVGSCEWRFDSVGVWPQVRHWTARRMSVSMSSHAVAPQFVHSEPLSNGEEIMLDGRTLVDDILI